MQVVADIELELRGAGGEPVDLWRTLVSHGVASLPPARLDEVGRTLELTVSLTGLPPRTIRLSEGATGRGRINVLGPPPGRVERDSLVALVRRVLALDDDLSPFHAAIATDPDLAWAAAGAGRMLRAPSVFEDVVKTICTTNCTWSATVRMTTVLVEQLGEPSVGDHGRAFPTPEAMAATPESFYRDVVRSGYRGAYLHALAESVASGSLDLEGLAAPEDVLTDEELTRRLLALPGVGPYAAAHVMMLLGRHSLLVLDSWTRPKYARLVGRKQVSDAAIARRFRRYGRYAGLAFWLFLTRDWVAGDA